MKAIQHPLSFLVAVFLFLGGTSCSSTSSQAPPPKLAAEGVDTLTQSSTEKLFADIRAQDSSEEIWVAYVGVVNKSVRPGMRNVLDEIDVVVGELFQNARYDEKTAMFRRVSKRLVETGMAAAGIQDPGDLVLKTKREAFIQTLTNEGKTPDYMMFGTITSIESDDGLRYRLSLEIMHYGGESIAQRSGTFTM